jgi:hypothetical protein
MPDNRRFHENAYGDFNKGDYVRGDVHRPQPFDVDEDRIEDGAVAEPAPLKDRGTEPNQ